MAIAMTFPKGTTARAIFGPLENNDGSTFDFTSMHVRMMVKKTTALPDEDAVIDLFIKVDASGDVTDSDGLSLGGTNTNENPYVVYPATAESGVLTVTIEDEKTEDVTPATYLYAIAIMPQAGDGEIYPSLSGEIVIQDYLMKTPELA